MESQLVETPRFFPGTCIDGRQDGPVIDTFYEPPGYGRVYLSQTMVRHAALLLGMVDKTDITERDEKLRKQDRRIAELEGELAELEPVKRALTSAAARYGTDD